MDHSTLPAILFLLTAMFWLQSRLYDPASRTGPKRYIPPRKTTPTAPTGRPRKNAKPEWVPAAIIGLAGISPRCGCRTLAHLFNRTYREIGVSVGKTYVSDVLRDDRMHLAQPRRYMHDIDTACPIRVVWGIDLTEHRLVPDIPQQIFGIIDHGSRRVLKLETLREKGSIALLRLLLEAIEQYGKPKSIRTDNEAIFTSWAFAFALRWLGIRHQRIEPRCPWMNGRIERVWSTFKQLLRMFDVKNEAELHATLNLLRDTYNQHRPHQSLSGHTPDEAWALLARRTSKRSHRRR